MFKRNSSNTRRSRRFSILAIILGFFLSVAIGILLYILNETNRLK
jgi:hypothetical protein